MLATPRACAGVRSSGASHTEMRLAVERTMLPTPTTSMVAGSDVADARTSGTDRRKRREMMATPQANNWKSGTGYDHGDKPQTPQLRHQSGGMLDPRPVEWMMGLPKNWVKAGGTIARTHQSDGSAETSPTEPNNSPRSEMELFLSMQRLLLRSLLAGRG